MSRRRKSTPPVNDLRRLALAGRWDDVRELLAERLARNPHDAEARSELERLQQGLPLRATESTLERRRREEREMREELEAELARYRQNPAVIESWEPAQLARQRKRAATMRSTLRGRIPAALEQEAAAYLKALTEKLGTRRSSTRRWYMAGLTLILLAAAAGLAIVGLQSWAERAENTLREALNSREIPRVQHALQLADTALNRLANNDLPALVRKAEAWVTRTERQRASLKEQITLLENGKGSIRTLSLSRRAELERTFQNLPENMCEWRHRWQQLCEREQRALAAQREEILQRFRAPLPPMPELCGMLAEDDARLRQQQQQLQTLAREWKAARELYAEDAGLGEPLRARLAELQQLRADIAALRQTVSLLPTARSYARYRQLFDKLTPKLYAPALRMAAIRDRLPDESKLRDLMQDHGRKLPEGMLEAARNALLKGGANFSPAFPANIRQVQLMEDLFTYTGLHKVLYEMSAANLPAVIVEERPRVSEESVTFSPSPLTPGYSLDTPRRITWHNPQGVFIRRIDATPLLKHAGIDRLSFFSSANLPTMLGSLLRLNDGECPNLARAFVFKRLLEVMSTHDWPTMLGIAYAPTLRADARSFASLLHELELPVEAGCWLQSSDEAKRAEEACARWFHERRHRHYAEEIARNFSSLVQVHPDYVGYIDEAGAAKLCHHLPEGTLLWYAAEDGLTATPLGEELESPIMYSPLFTVAKD